MTVPFWITKLEGSQPWYRPVRIFNGAMAELLVIMLLVLSFQ